MVSYLHALDRVVHVTSGANIYPLPPAIPDMTAMAVLANGIAGAGLGAPTGSLGLPANTTAGNNIGSDEALGGALLTPIPWLARRANGGTAGVGGGGGSSEDGSSDAGSTSPLSSGSSSGGGSVSTPSAQQQPSRQPPTTPTASSQASNTLSAGGGRNSEPQLRTESTETIEGPNGMGSIETVSISVNGIPSMGAAGGSALTQRGVTQGELLRQEQRAGVVPVSQLARHGQTVSQQQQQQHAQQQATAANSSASTETASADEDASMGEDATAGENGGGEEEEVEHARGPEEIGAADTGPRPESSSPFTVAEDGTVEMQGIDIEAAVGRRLASPEQQSRTSSSPDSKIPMSPKREATEELEAGAAKKVKEGDSQEPEKKPKTDAEGDVVIPDSSKPAAEGNPIKQEAEAAVDEDKPMTGSGNGGDGKEPDVKAETSPSE